MATMEMSQKSLSKKGTEAPPLSRGQALPLRRQGHRGLCAIVTLCLCYFVPLCLGSLDVRPTRQDYLADNLHLAGQELASFQGGPDRQVMVFRGGFAMSVAQNQLSSDQAVLWLQRSAPKKIENRKSKIENSVLAYLKGNVLVKKNTGAKTPDLSQTVIQDSGAMVVRFDISGEVFTTADKKRPQLNRGCRLGVLRGGLCSSCSL